MSSEIRPNKAELEFLTISYNRFYDIYDEVISEIFWEKDEWYRYSRVKEGYSVYSELLNYEPIKWVIENLRLHRPPMEAEIAGELFKFIRNVIIHFPFFDSWDQVYITKSLVNWNSKGKSIDRFLQKYVGGKTIKYRFWEEDKKLMTYLSINYPEYYSDDIKIFLKDIVSEKEGVKFSYILMKKVIDTQVEK